MRFYEKAMLALTLVIILVGIWQVYPFGGASPQQGEETRYIPIPVKVTNEFTHGSIAGADIYYSLQKPKRNDEPWADKLGTTGEFGSVSVKVPNTEREVFIIALEEGYYRSYRKIDLDQYSDTVVEVRMPEVGEIEVNLEREGTDPGIGLDLEEGIIISESAPRTPEFRLTISPKVSSKPSVLRDLIVVLGGVDPDTSATTVAKSGNLSGEFKWSHERERHVAQFEGDLREEIEIVVQLNRRKETHLTIDDLFGSEEGAKRVILPIEFK